MQEIVKLFLFHNKLKFSEIEKMTNLRSNKVSYYLKNLVKKGVIEKSGEFYILSESSETVIPYLSEKKAVLPVILIAIKKDKKIFLYSREKRPYKGKLSLPGGRILIGESMKQATKRIMKEKFGINSAFKKINSIALEHVKKNGKIVHSFMLALISAETKDKIDYTDITKNKSKIIPSDYFLIKNYLNKEIRIKTLFSRD